VLSLKERWLQGEVERRGGWLMFQPEKHFVGGMSGSPIINAAGAAIGVVSVDCMSPVIVDSLSAQLLREINSATPKRKKNKSGWQNVKPERGELSKPLIMRAKK